ncbi:hypothetical protein [Flammeovirga sp. SJP92]|uniref:hypothetical protein n=1 Tax=Flammeovirga sp. SJP92 TaxID=1775430 RepID=UPI00078686CF|nr:hypothetical protein [Flammeovirga sp. SJP92]KXX69178.1 hypothetical protein AVL50_16525 [Flammeovirga sp. SJP92]
MPSIKSNNTSTSNVKRSTSNNSNINFNIEGMDNFFNNFQNDINTSGGDIISQFQTLEKATHDLEKMKKQVQEMKWQHEAFIVQKLRKEFVENKSVFFKKLISFAYPLSKELYLKHKDILVDSLIQKNVHTYTFKGRPDYYDNDKYYYYPKFDLDLSKMVYYEDIGKNENMFFSDELLTLLSTKEILFSYLSKNNSIEWSFDRIEQFKDRINFKNLLQNKSIDWSEDSANMLYERFYTDKEINDKKGIELKEYILETAKSNRISSLYKYGEYSDKILDDNLGTINWSDLSRNKYLPFTLQYLIRYKDFWKYDKLVYNRGLYEKVFEPILNDNIVDDLLTLCCYKK